MSAGIDQPPRPPSQPGGSSEDQSDSPDQTKSKPGPHFLGLTRCAACYKHKARSRLDSCDTESSSSAGDSGPELDWESEDESSSSSSSSERLFSEEVEKPEGSNVSPDKDKPAETESGGGVGGGETEKTFESQEDKTKKGITNRAPLLKSFSLPSSFRPQLLPISLLPRPPTVVSILQLQVLSQRSNSDPYIIKQKHPTEREEKTQGGYGAWPEGFNGPQTQQLSELHKKRLMWRQRSQPSLQQPHQPHLPNQNPQPAPELPYQHLQTQTHHLAPFSGQRLPPPMPPHPMLQPQTLPAMLFPQVQPQVPPPLLTPLQTPNSSHTHLVPLQSQPCWCCYRMPFPYT